MLERKQEPAGGGRAGKEKSTSEVQGMGTGQKSANYNSIVDDFPNKYKWPKPNFKRERKPEYRNNQEKKKK